MKMKKVLVEMEKILEDRIGIGLGKEKKIKSEMKEKKEGLKGLKKIVLKKMREKLKSMLEVIGEKEKEKVGILRMDKIEDVVGSRFIVSENGKDIGIEDE